MKRSEIIAKMMGELCLFQTNEEAESVLNLLEEAGMRPKHYIHPMAYADGLVGERGEDWGYILYIDKFPEHYFLRGRPYEYYLEGWEPEDD